MNTDALVENALFEIENVTIRHRHKVLLQIDSLKIPKNKLVIFIGANGAGKSTLLHAMIGQTSGGAVSSEGTILMSGQPVEQLLSQGKIAWVGQHERFELPLTVLDYALLGTSPNLSWYQRPNAAQIEHAKAFLQIFELLHLSTSRIQSLSGGEKQRLAIVRALMQSTDIILLDEPTNHLDIRHQKALLKYLQEQVHQCGKSMVVVLHDLTHAYRYADEVVLLHQGKLVMQGRPEEVMTEERLSEVYQVSLKSYDTDDGRFFM